MAIRHQCSLRVTDRCAQGSGRGPAKCRGCGGAVYRQEGVYGVFTWRGDGKYRIEDAHATYQTERAAERRLVENENWVVRFV